MRSSQKYLRINYIFANVRLPKVGNLRILNPLSRVSSYLFICCDTGRRFGAIHVLFAVNVRLIKVGSKACKSKHLGGNKGELKYLYSFGYLLFVAFKN